MSLVLIGIILEIAELNRCLAYSGKTVGGTAR